MLGSYIPKGSSLNFVYSKEFLSDFLLYCRCDLTNSEILQRLEEILSWIQDIKIVDVREPGTVSKEDG